MQCDACGSYHFVHLGILGQLAHFTCRACGMESSMDVDEYNEMVELELVE